MATSFAITLGAASPMTHDEKVFFQQLGARIAALRKGRRPQPATEGEGR